MSTELILRSFLKLEIICAALNTVTPSPPSPPSLESHCTSSSGPGSVVGGWNMIQFRSLYFPLTLGRQLPALTTKQFITASFLQTMFHASHSAHLVAVVGSIRCCSRLWQYLTLSTHWSRGHCSTALLPLCWQYETPGNLLGLLLLRQSPQLWTATAIELVYICSMSKWIRWSCSCHLNYTLADMFIYISSTYYATYPYGHF